MKIHLSKSAFIRGLICHKALFYAWFYPELAEDMTPQKQNLFDIGHEVEAVARTLFPDGKDMSIDTTSTRQVIQNTQIALAFGEKVLYQASFGSSSGYCRTDILINDKKRILYEVKSSTKCTDVQIIDVAFQYFIMKEAGYPPDEVYLMYLNNEYVRGKNLSVTKLFKTEDVLQSVLNMQEDIPRGIKEMKDMLEKVIPPDKNIGLHCDKPFTCDFRKHCWKHIPSDSIFDIARLTKKKKFELYEVGIIQLEDIPSTTKLNHNQQMQVRMALEKSHVVDKEKIQGFVSTLDYPLYFLDFESIQPAIPRFPKTKPYQQITFQYSLHIQSAEGDVNHLEFLADPHKDFRLQLLRQLLKDTEGVGTIVTYNMAFEIGRMKELAVQFPKYQEEIYNRISRTKDLMVVFRDRHYYHHAMKGSYSIKNVLPVLVPELSYKNLDIRDGASASVTFEQLKKLDTVEAKEKREQLLEYCKLDTWAMVCILKVLKDFI
ncbi:MAG: DUF2779 domain-containing protein [Bacteroidetes bacterium]|nr:DUF2779 domain-containing protein [Bacteroidota bacterium]